jgi:Glycosyl transferase family 2
MKLVLTLLARDEADVIDSWLAFHLNAGADFVIATDNRSEDGTTETLERYAREGHIHLIREPGEDLRQDEWVTRMARLAATDFGADWVINSDADEFWWPRGASLRDVLAAVPPRYGTVGAFLRMFVPRPGDEEPFERMTVRFSALAPINDPASLYKPIRKVVHRAHPEIRLARGNHALIDSPFAPLRGWFPIEVFHFPLRSLDQTTHKAALQGHAFEKYVKRPPTAYHANMFEALRSGRIDEYYASLLVDDDEVECGVAEGRLVVDTRLRDALRELRVSEGGPFRPPSKGTELSFPLPTLVEDATYAVEAAVLGEADVVRLQRRLDTLERRLQTLELRLPNRVYRKLSGTAKRALRRD